MYIYIYIHICGLEKSASAPGAFAGRDSDACAAFVRIRRLRESALCTAKLVGPLAVNTYGSPQLYSKLLQTCAEQCKTHGSQSFLSRAEVRIAHLQRHYDDLCADHTSSLVISYSMTQRTPAVLSCRRSASRNREVFARRCVALVCTECLVGASSIYLSISLSLSIYIYIHIYIYIYIYIQTSCKSLSTHLCGGSNSGSKGSGDSSSRPFVRTKASKAAVKSGVNQGWVEHL